MLHPLLLPSTLLFSLWAATPAVLAGTVGYLQTCDPARQKLQEGTYQFQTDCDPMTYCASNSTCLYRGCRNDEFPFGYSANVPLPDRCDKGSFCPDEQNTCLPQLAIGSPCQFNRDDECAPPPNAGLADTSGFGLNVDGAVCLNNICYWANVTAGNACVVQNTAYTAYGPGGEFIDIVSRGNCQIGLYCDSVQKTCIQTKAIGEQCDADKECSTFNCLASGTCGHTTDTPTTVGSWVYAIVGICIVGGMAGTLVALYFWHRSDRRKEREKRAQYMREQMAFRQNVFQMRDAFESGSIRGSAMLATPGGSPRSSTLYQHSGDLAETPRNGGSGLRYVADAAGGSNEELIQKGGHRF